MNTHLQDQSADAIPFDLLWQYVSAFPEGEVAGCHGLSHWKRVEKYGLRIARYSGADVTVVRLFALFHDAARINNDIDEDHADKTHILKIAYVMSRFDYPLLNNILSTHYNQTETLNYLEKLTGVKSTTLKNIRDRFDPYVKQERSNRRGWYQVQLTPDYLEIKAEYDDKGEEFIAEEIKNILQLFK